MVVKFNLVRHHSPWAIPLLSLCAGSPAVFEKLRDKRRDWKPRTASDQSLTG